MNNTLLLNASYETIGFISFRRLIKLITKNKVEVLSEWDDAYIRWVNGQIRHPATVRLKYYVRSVQRKVRFNKKAVFKRDIYVCQYCGKGLTLSECELEHIIPQCQGGQSAWENCVTACHDCNSKKANKTPEQAGMTLLSKPSKPVKSMIYQEYKSMNPKHGDWKNYFHS